MNYLKEDIRHALAAKYVLGTLRGAARCRFQKLLMQHQLLKETTWKWEQYLNELGQRVPEIEPSERVWGRLETRLGFSDIKPEQPKADETKYKKRSSMWRSLSALAAAAALVLVVTWFLSIPPAVPLVSQIAIISDEEATPLWLVELSKQRIKVRTTERLVARDDKDFELWMVPDNGGPPVSLGLLPEGGAFTAEPSLQLLQLGFSILAVSLEPPGGSRNGAPTEVLYLAELLSV